MYYLPITNDLGTITIETIYSFYDVPRTFLAKSKKINTLFLVYWFNESETCDSWYYVPMNDLEVSNLNSGSIQIRDFFINKYIYILSTPFDTSDPGIELVFYNYINNETLPPVGYFIEMDSDGDYSINYNDEKEILSNIHEVRIYRDRSEKNIDWEPIQKIINAWNSIYNKLAKTTCDSGYSLIPYTSSIGSYKSKFIAENNDFFIGRFVEFLDVIKSSCLDFNEIKKLEIDLDDFEGLISNLIAYNYKLDVKSNTGALLFTLDAKKMISEKEKIQEHNQRHLSSDLVPQADDLNRLFKLIDCAGNNRLFNEESEKITERQVNYYKHAARLLGLIKESSFILQPLGWKVFLTDDFDEKIILLIQAFENTDCGWAWMKFCDVEKAVKINEITALEFLREKASGLSEDTAKRRSRTLRSWITTFKTINQEYY